MEHFVAQLHLIRQSSEKVINLVVGDVFLGGFAHALQVESMAGKLIDSVLRARAQIFLTILRYILCALLMTVVLKVVVMLTLFDGIRVGLSRRNVRLLMLLRHLILGRRLEVTTHGESSSRLGTTRLPRGDHLIRCLLQNFCGQGGAGDG